MEGITRGGNLPGGKCQGGNCPWGEVTGGESAGGNCPGVKCPITAVDILYFFLIELYIRRIKFKSFYIYKLITIYFRCKNDKNRSFFTYTSAENYTGFCFYIRNM